MGTLAAEYYIDAVGDKAAAQSLDAWANAVSIHPALKIPIFASTDIDKLDDTSGNRYVFGVCARTPGVFQVISAVKPRTYDDPEAARKSTSTISGDRSSPTSGRPPARTSA